jgi:DNA-binding response OmpR family regulator
MRVLVADDDTYLVEITTYALRREGFNVLVATDGEQALRTCSLEHPDIMLLDVNLPKVNGFEVCRRLRQDSDIPVILMTARSAEEDIVRGLRLGADDYVVKPFSVRQLVARMEAALRRSQANAYDRPSVEVELGDLVLNMDSHEVTRDGQPVQLTPLEFRILHLLAMNAGRVIPYARLVEYAWGYDGGDPSLLKTHIYHIRQKLSLSPREPNGIRAVSGVGYSLARQA